MFAMTQVPEPLDYAAPGKQAGELADAIPWVLLGVLITPVAAVLAILSGGGGHGHYLFAKLFFPYSMLTTLATTSITTPAIVFALLQFPLYGGFAGGMAVAGRSKQAILLIACLHLLAVMTCFVAPMSNFS